MIPNIEKEKEQKQTSELLESVIKWSLRIIGVVLSVFFVGATVLLYIMS